MAARLVLAPEAEADLAEAYGWYERRKAGLGEEFLEAMESCVAKIRLRPRIFPIVHEGYRRALVRKFPYAVFYEEATSLITIYAVFHVARDQAKWRGRLPS